MADHEEVDWQAVALALAQSLRTCLNHMELDGSDFVVNLKTGESRSFLDTAADALEMYPSVRVDREILALKRITNKRERRKALKDLMKAREVQN